MRARGSRPLAGSSSRRSFGVVNQDAGQAQPLLHAPAQCPDDRPAFFGQADQFQHIAHGFFALRGRDFVAGAEEIQVFGHFHVLVNAEEIRHVTDDVPDGVGFAHDVLAEDVGGAGGGGKEGGENAQGGGFARAVGADEAEQIALVDCRVRELRAVIEP